MSFRAPVCRRACAVRSGTRIMFEVRLYVPVLASTPTIVTFCVRSPFTVIWMVCPIGLAPSPKADLMSNSSITATGAAVSWSASVTKRPLRISRRLTWSQSVSTPITCHTCSCLPRYTVIVLFSSNSAEIPSNAVPSLRSASTSRGSICGGAMVNSIAEEAMEGAATTALPAAVGSMNTGPM